MKRIQNFIKGFKRELKDTKLLKGFLRKLYNQIIIKDLENWITESWKRLIGYKTAQKNS